jgi:dolichol-phosphate mannosyltransferase
MAGVASELSQRPASKVTALPAPELCVIIPLRNAGDRVAAVLPALSRTLTSCAWEIVFVDDHATDGTADLASAIAESDGRVRCLRRIGPRGRAAACLDGMLATQARYLAVMDVDAAADGLPATMLALLRDDTADVVSARGAATGRPVSELHARARTWGNAIVRRALRVAVDDPMSGLFMIRRSAFDAVLRDMPRQGTNILFDLLFAARGRLRVAELPAAPRLAAVPLSSAGALLELAGILVGRASRGTISIRFLMFCLVGLSGVGIHMAILRVALLNEGFAFAAAQTMAAVSAMIWNFTLNNLFTYRDRRLTGRAFFTGLIRFQIICAVGALSNVGIASLIYRGGSNWWVAGLAGVLMGAVWNYAVTSVFVWRKP